MVRGGLKGSVMTNELRTTALDMLSTSFRDRGHRRRTRQFRYDGYSIWKPGILPKQISGSYLQYIITHSYFQRGDGMNVIWYGSYDSLTTNIRCDDIPARFVNSLNHASTVSRREQPFCISSVMRINADDSRLQGSRATSCDNGVKERTKTRKMREWSAKHNSCRKQILYSLLTRVYSLVTLVAQTPSAWLVYSVVCFIRHISEL